MTPREQAIKDLVTFGFTPEKALEIAMDCERGDEYALAWLVEARRTIREMKSTTGINLVTTQN